MIEYVLNNNILVLPANFVGEPADSAVLSTGLQPQDTEGLWYNHTLGSVVWWWDTLKDLKALQSSLPTGSLVWNHASDSLIEDAGWSTEVERTTGLVETGGLSEVGMIFNFIGYRSQQSSFDSVACFHRYASFPSP